MMSFVVGWMLQFAVASPGPPAVPFAVGESLVYTGYHSLVPFGGVGSATMTVVSVDTAQGVASWHFRLTTQVSVPFYKNRSELSSWTGIGDFISRRFVHVVNENGKLLANDDFHIHGDSGYYRNHADTLRSPTPANPLDDLAFIYFIRTQHFELGGKYTYDRYFKKRSNPLVVSVLGRETMRMPDGTRRTCWLLNPVLEEPHGMFAKAADARLWITDDGLRIPVQIRSKIAVGSVTLKLQKITR